MPALKGVGLLKGLGVTLKTMTRPAATRQYPHVKPDLPARSRGVIALIEENCTVCMLCARECPDWCIYIDSHKEQVAPKEGGRARTRNILDRFAIDYALCMYCGICVEVCPFDALFWSPEFEYAEYGISELIHEKEKLGEWTYTVLPPPELEEGAEPVEEAPAPEAHSEAPTSAAPIATPGDEAASPPSDTALRPAPGQPPPAAGAPQAEAAAGGAREAAEPAPAEAMEETPAPGEAQPPPHDVRAEVEPDQETYDRVLAGQLADAVDRRVAEGRAKSAAIRAARAQGEGA